MDNVHDNKFVMILKHDFILTTSFWASTRTTVVVFDDVLEKLVSVLVMRFNEGLEHFFEWSRKSILVERHGDRVKK
jgi:hypothetical protein